MSRALAAAVPALAVLLLGCRNDMHDQPRYEVFERSTLFPDRLSARPQLPNTVAQGQLQEDGLLATGREGSQLSAVFPAPVTREMIQRGRQRFNIYCAPCHSQLGDGEGMIVQRGFRKPPSFHIERLRTAPVGHYFDVITNGFGAMTSYGARVPVADRWAIIAYIRALQYSQNASMADVPADQRSALQAPPEGSHSEAGRGQTPASAPRGPNAPGPRQPQPSEAVPGRTPGARR